ncbi:MAG: prenyltransferase/squalene oxidase repeat-containing protein [candidate division WOR-3 bacterium]
MNRQGLLLVCFCVSLLLANCRSWRVGQNRETSDSTDAPIETPWRNNLIRWLEMGYVEDADSAAFASVDVRFLRYPNLYSTYSVVRILTTLGEGIEDASAIGGWLLSMQKEDGSFDDSLNDLPILIETYWAVSILNDLNIAPPNKDGIVRFVCSLRKTDGFFSPDTSLGGSAEEQALVATAYAIKLLLLVDSVKIAPCLQGMPETLLNHLHSHRPQEFSLEDEKGYFIVLGALARLSPRSISPLFLSDLGQAVNNVPSLPADPASLSYVNELYDVAISLGRTETKEIHGNLRQYVVDRLLPASEAQIGYLWTPGPPDPMLTYLMLRLFHGAGVPYPRQADLLHLLSKYRVRSGWLTFVHPLPDPESTYYALRIADQIGYPGYDDTKISAYLRRFVQPRSASEMDLRGVYFAVQGLALLHQSPERPTRVALQEMAETKFFSLPEEEREGEVLWLIRSAGVLGWALSDALQEQVSQGVQPRLSRLSSSSYRMRDLYEIFLLQTILGVEIVREEEITAKVLHLKSPEGGFLARTMAPGPDIHSTRFALEILSAFHALGGIDRSTTRNFVLSCRDDFGFNIVPVSAIAASPDVYGSLSPDFSSTYDGFRILEILSQP